MLLMEIIIMLLLGIIVGTISGLTPGIHINMISLLVLAASPILISQFHLNIISLGVFIISVGVTHTFLDALPSIFLGCPDENTALGVLPGHRYLLRGNGLMAVKLFTIGSFVGVIAAIIIFPILYLITKYSYHILEPAFAIILIVTSVFMLWRDQKRLWAIFVFIIAGLFGMIVFNMNISDPLFPMLSGLFGVATLIISLNDKNTIPAQNNDTVIKLEKKKTFLSIIAGNISGFIVSTFPGLSGSIAAVISVQVVRDIKDHGFMILMGCIGTVSFILSLVALYTVNKARNGAVIVIAKLMPVDFWTIVLFLIVSLIVASISVFLAMYFGRVFSRIITKVNYRALIFSIIAFITIMVFILCSWKGLLILTVATAIGVIPGIVKIQRTQSMACLIVPIITYLI